MLTQTLRAMERDGLIERNVYDELPLRVEYMLSPLAHTLLPLVVALKAGRRMRWKRSKRTTAPSIWRALNKGR